jgi:hypothetical protein
MAADKSSVDMCAAAMQVASAGALSIALQHPAITGNFRTVCSLLRTCKAWQAALQQCTAGHLSINTAFAPSLHKPLALSRFAVWLPKHSGLVGQLLLGRERNSKQTADEFAAAEQILALSIQHAANRAAAPEAAPLLRLRSITINFVCSPALLQALPAAALTKLVLSYSRNDWPAHLNLNSSNITQGLQRLTGLQELHLQCSEQCGNWVQNACLAAVGQLTQLTKLQMCCVAAGSNLSLLLLQLCDLQLRVCCSSSTDSSGSSTAVALGHLSVLRQLELYLYGDPGLGSSLPTGLTGLTSWRHLSALKALYLYSMCMVGSDEQVSNAQLLGQADSLALLECLAAAASLTHLQLMGLIEEPQQAWCGYLTSLQQLRCLTLYDQLPLDREDLLQLTALTNLRGLKVVEVAALDDAAAVALAMQLTNLRQLCLEQVRLTSAAALPALAALTGLTRLFLSTSCEMVQLDCADLKLLTALTRLRVFDTENLFDEEAVPVLWDSARRRWRRQQQQL